MPPLEQSRLSPLLLGAPSRDCCVTPQRPRSPSVVSASPARTTSSPLKSAVGPPTSWAPPCALKTKCKYSGTSVPLSLHFPHHSLIHRDTGCGGQACEAAAPSRLPQPRESRQTASGLPLAKSFSSGTLFCLPGTLGCGCMEEEREAQTGSPAQPRLKLGCELRSA